MSGPLVVVGDVLLDVDLAGRSDRLSPEAPVPVVDIEQSRHRPGGAGLAAWLAAGTEARATEVVLVTALADDDAGRTLAGLLRRRVEVVALPLDGGTPVKTRLSTGGQPTLRMDAGTGRAAGPLPLSVRSALAGAGAVLVSDYGRGVSALPDLRAVLAAVAARVPVVWDPHPRGAAPVTGARLVTPNESEAVAALGGAVGEEHRGRWLRQRWRCAAVAVTVGARGAVLTTEAGETTVPVPPAAQDASEGPIDTCGAGDAFAAATAAAYRLGGQDAEAVATGVASASGFVRAGAAGAVARDATRTSLRGLDPYAIADHLRRTGGTLVATGGCFDLLHRGHASLLAQARALGDALIVCLNSDASVRRAKGLGRPLVSENDRAEMLRALAAVDGVVVFDEDTPSEVLNRLRPQVWVKGGDYEGVYLAEAEVVRRHGGRVALVPTVNGYSTTRLVSLAAPHRSEIS
ncbi:MAG: PfkB family carbohydrate kinase [Actinomycetes bacterium]